MPLLSVIVPVYNVEAYLDDCLASICGQSFDDMEIICVNDGSTDDSRAVLACWQERDARICVIDQPNKGLSGARNTGILTANGAYLCFVDSDDELEPGACARIVEALQASDAEVLVFGAHTFPKETDDPWLASVLSPRQISYRRFTPDVLFNEASTPYVWRVAVKAPALKRSGLLFDESLAFGEDQLFLFSLYPQVTSIQFIPDKLYRYRLARSGSLMDKAQERSVTKVEKNLEIAKRILSYWSDKGFLATWPSDLMAWSVKFVLYSILCQERSARDRMVTEFVYMWRSSMSDERLRTLALPAATRAMVDLALRMAGEGPKPSERTIKAVMVRYRLDTYGVSSFASSVVRKFRRSY